MTVLFLKSSSLIDYKYTSHIFFFKQLSQLAQGAYLSVINYFNIITLIHIMAPMEMALSLKVHQSELYTYL